MYDLFYDENRKRFYIIKDGNKLHIGSCQEVKGIYTNGNDNIISGIVYCSSTIYRKWYIIDDKGNDYIPLINLKQLEIKQARLY